MAGKTGYVQNLLANESTISNYLKKGTIGISAHVLTGKKEEGYLFYFPLNGPEQDKLFSLLKQHYSRSPEFKYSEAQSMNNRIAEITFKKEGANFSIGSAGGALFGSFSGFLVEEVVRNRVSFSTEFC